jgi:geranylgeranyl diphosphate synthase type II|tara:strand:+ start:4834 stop:5730 length:897 start_codon:yes stop_codon:yes gene_type:complete
MSTSGEVLLSQYMTQVRQEVDHALADVATYGDGCPVVLGDAIRHILLAPGKRLRPMLVLMASDACGNRSSATIASACAVEMIHTYSLIHDDLPAMDDDELRRGLPTVHVVYGEANAILAGDALLAQAFEVIARCQATAEQVVRCLQELTQAAGPCQLVGGQVDDLQAENTVGNAGQLQKIHERKTGAMFRVSLRLGAIAADATDEQITRLDTYGKHLGLAFQIVDDLLDLQGDVEQLGKQTGKDTEHGKLTYPALMGVKESQDLAADLIKQACEQLEPFGETAEPLRQLAYFVLERNN